MLSPLEPDLVLPELVARAARGPQRDGLFALWLVARVAGDLVLEPPIPERPVRRRLDALEHRLSSLTLPAPLRRALPGALALLRDGDRRAPGTALQQLVAPVRESLGAEAAETIARTARALRGGRPSAG